MSHQGQRRSAEHEAPSRDAREHTDDDSVDHGGPSDNDPVATPASIVRTLFAHMPPGWIEIRLIPDGVRGAGAEREWYAGLEDFLADLPGLTARAHEAKLGVFLGVMPRRERGSGTSADVLPGLGVWADLDFKDFEGGEEEARAVLAKFPIAPTVIVRSGHGLHAYWLLDEPLSPEKLSALAKGVATSVGGDYVHDAARVMRLPGTTNWKDPEHPVEVTIECFAPEQRPTAAELHDAIELVTPRWKGQENSRARQAPRGSIPGRMSSRVAALVRSRKRIGLLFNGEGKPELGDDGKPLDTSSSGYDFSLVIALVKAGIRDEDELAAALWARPDGAARAKGGEYVYRTARKAIELAETAEQAVAELGVNFEVERLRIFNSNPATYEVTVTGTTFVLTSPELRSPGKFAVKFMDALHRVPEVPRKLEDWTPIVNHWLEGAEIVSLPPDASYTAALRERLERMIADLPVGDAVEDLDHGRAVVLADGRRAFKVDPLLRLLRDEWPSVDRAALCQNLHAMGFASASERLGGMPVRAWTRNGETA